MTPGGELTTVLDDAGYTAWVVEPLVKKKADIGLIGAWATAPKCDVEAVNRAADAFGERGIVRGHICCFDVFGQPGCWQDACASVISPGMFDRFVAPYDCALISAAHKAGQRIVYHLCGRLMPVLDSALAMRPDAIETFTPSGMGGDADLARAKAKAAGRACMIGGFDQFHFFTRRSPADTRAEARRCFREAGAGGGYILSPSDHFFEAELPLLEAFASEAAACVY